jgi:hypothetical protein
LPNACHNRNLEDKALIDKEIKQQRGVTEKENTLSK